VTRHPPGRTARRAAIGTLVGLAAAGVLAPWLAPFDPVAQPDILAGAGRPPHWPHVLGTDAYSRDVLSRLLHGTRVSLGLGLAAGGLAAALGTLVGLASGASPRWLDGMLMRGVDTAVAIPRVVVLATAVAIWGALPAPLLVLLMAATGWFGIARLVRTEVRALRGTEWMTAAVAQGVPPWRRWWHHLLPAVWPTIGVAATLAVAQTIALEAAVSFLGIGVRPPQSSWGTLLADAADHPWRWWWLAAAPGATLVATLLACNALADGLRERHRPGEVASP
jgi:ABC-type dipeptide/oligopeptide/nickel transport system permease subunit